MSWAAKTDATFVNGSSLIIEALQNPPPMLIGNKLPIPRREYSTLMTRGIATLVVGILVAALTLSAAAGGYLGTVHEIARAGQTQLVICGATDARTVTLDRDGNLVERLSTTCGHCADCMMVPICVDPAPRDLPGPSGILLRAEAPEPAGLPRPARTGLPEARGPPVPEFS